MRRTPLNLLLAFSSFSSFEDEDALGVFHQVPKACAMQLSDCSTETVDTNPNRTQQRKSSPFCRCRNHSHTHSSYMSSYIVLAIINLKSQVIEKTVIRSAQSEMRDQARPTNSPFSSSWHLLTFPTPFHAPMAVTLSPPPVVHKTILE